MTEAIITIIPQNQYFKSHPIRLGLKRAYRKGWWVSRDGVVIGEVDQKDEGWVATRGSVEVRDGKNILFKRYTLPREPSSFRTAVLSLARIELGNSSGGVGDRGELRALSTNVDHHEFLVLLEKDREHLFKPVYGSSVTNDKDQAILRKVKARVTKWKKENL